LIVGMTHRFLFTYYYYKCTVYHLQIRLECFIHFSQSFTGRWWRIPPE